MLFLFVAVIDLLAASFLMKPFKKLQERLNMVSEGNLDQDIQVDDYKETRGISNAVSQTLRKLKAVDQVGDRGICIKCIARIENTDHIDPSPRGFPDGDGGVLRWSFTREFMVDISDEIRPGKERLLMIFYP